MLKDVIKVIKDEIKLTAKNNSNQKIVNNNPKIDTNNTNILTSQESPYAVELEIRSCVDKRLVSAFTCFAVSSANIMGLKLSRGPAPLEPKYDRWTVLSSPFVHKTARTQFERREHCRVLKIEGIWREDVAAKFVWYLKRHVPNEVTLGITLHERGYLDIEPKEEIIVDELMR